MRRSPSGAGPGRRPRWPRPGSCRSGPALTAAHCVDFVDVPGGIPLSDLRVVVGRTVLTSTQGQKRRVASPINGITPIMLVTPGVDALERPGTLATVTGWGNADAPIDAT